MKNWIIGVCGAVGGTVCVVADLAQKSDASALNTIGVNLGRYLGLPYANIWTTVLIIGFATALCYIFDVKTKKAAFYTGLSVLAIMMTAVPYRTPDSLKGAPNSVGVNLALKTSDGGQVQDAKVTLLDQSGKRVIGESIYKSGNIVFYQDGGVYRLRVEVPGYAITEREISLVEGSEPVGIILDLEKSIAPLFIQRWFKK